MQREVFSQIVLAFLFSLALSHLTATELSDIVPADAKLREIASGLKFSEGPAWSPKGYLLFTDIPASRIIRLMDDGSLKDVLNPSDEANGLLFDPEGRLYVCQHAARRVIRLDVENDGKITVLADRYDGKRLNSPNDLAFDGKGGVYFTDPRYGNGDNKEQPVHGVYYIAADGKLTRIVEDLPQPNGILVSPDGKHLYVAETHEDKLYRWEIEAPGKIANRILFYDVDKDRDGGGPDGMALDEHGNLYATYKRVLILSPEGKLIGGIDTPQRPANCQFGGKDGKTLFITARTSVYAIDLKVRGAALRSGLGVTTRVAEKKTRTHEIRDIILEIPTSWKNIPPRSRMRAAQFQVPASSGDPEPGEFVVYFFGKGQGGGVKANIDRWIGQFASEGRQSKQTTGKSRNGNYTLVDIKGTYNKPIGPPVLRKTKPTPGVRMFGAILETLGGNYFLKFTGPEKTVTATARDFARSFGAE